MTKEEIIRLMRESVKDHSEYYADCADPKGEDLEVFVKFAELVIAVEREACAKVCEDHPGIRTVNGAMMPPDGSTCARSIRSQHDNS